MSPVRTEAAAFAPGHITGFFEICDDADDPAQIGSRGAGFSVDCGVTSRVLVDDGGVPGVSVVVDGSPSEAATTRRAVDLLAGTRALHVRVDQTADLPVSQGFGMSAAGSLSAALGVAEALRLPRREAVWAAHCAEVMQRTGLGDVVGSNLGGFEVRTAPGVEPYGRIKAWKPDAPVGSVLLCVVSPTVLTKRVLTDPQRRAEIVRIGRAAVDAFQDDPTLARFVDASRRFAVEAGLATPEISKAWSTLGPGVRSGQAQLGGSVFVFGAGPETRRSLERMGPVHPVSIDFQGARVVTPRKVLA